MATTRGNKSKWCYTVESPPDIKVEPDFGTQVWGWVPDVPEVTGKYIIKVFSATSSLGETTGTLNIQFLGTKNISDWITLTDHGLTRGAILEKQVQMDVVGDIVVANVLYKGQGKYLCDYIVVSMNFNIWQMPCSNALGEEKDMFVAVGNIEFKINIDVEEGCKDPAWITIYGNAGTTVKSVLSDHGFMPGPFEKTILGDSIGDIFKVRIDKMVSSCDLSIKQIKVSYIGGNVEWGLKKVFSVSTSWTMPKKKPEEPPKPPKKGAVVPPPKTPNPKEKIEEELKLVDTKEAGKYFDGKCLPETQEKESIANKLTCETKFADKIDLFNVSETMTPQMFPLGKAAYFKCPPGCAAKPELETIGGIIHPQSATICTSAWADRAIDHNGGVFQIVMTNAQETYKHPFYEYANRVKLIGGGEKSNVAFVTAKVDNTSMTSKKIRLINGDKIDSEGRLEIKIERVWTTVKPIEYDKAKKSQSAMMADLAASACKYLGYKSGIWAGTDGNDLTEVFPQYEIYCHKTSDSFPCEIKLPQGSTEEAPAPVVPDHSVDVKITCTKKDLAVEGAGAGSGPGSAGMLTPFEGMTDNFPFIDKGGGKKALICDTAFKGPDDKVNMDVARFFCKSRGHPDADSDYLGVEPVDAKFKKASQFVFAANLGSLNKEKMKAKVVLAEEPCKYVAKLKCKGSADPPKIKANPKDMGRLPGPAVRKIDCSTSAKDLELEGFLKGDAGSVYTFICPPNCDKGGTLVGAGLYAFKSPICMAAIHQYFLAAPNEGYVSIVIGYPKFEYIGRANSDKMESERFPAQKDFSMSDQPITWSYAIISTNSCYLFGIEEERFRFKQIDTSSIKTNFKSTKAITINLNQDKSTNKLAVKTFNQRMNVSFIQMRKGKSGYEAYSELWFKGAQCSFCYFPLENELRDLNMGNTDEGIDLGKEVGHKETQDLGEGFSIITGFNIEQFPNTDYLTIFSHSGNNCYELVIKDLKSKEVPPSLTFRVKGKAGLKYNFSTKITPAEGVPVHVVFSYFKGKMIWYMNGKMGQVEGDGLEFSDFTPETCPGALTLGNNNDHFFMSGTVYYWALFREVWSSEKVQHFHKAVKTTVLFPKGGGQGGGAMTNDDRACISPVFPAPPPPSPSAPTKAEAVTAEQLEIEKEQKKFMEKEQQKAKAKGKELTNSSDESVEAIAEALAASDPKKEAELMDGPGAEMGSDFASCIVPAKHFYQQEGLIETEAGDFSQSGLKITCPPRCGEIAAGQMVVFGPEQSNNPKSKYVFGLDSAICGAALYVGAYEDEKGGSVLIHLTKANGEILKGDDVNGIKSKTGDAAVMGLFYMSPSPPPIELSCLQLAIDSPMEKSDAKVVQVECPKGCYDAYRAKKPTVVFGSFSVGYTWDSSPCMAAMHAGYLSNSRKAQLSVLVSVPPEGEKEFPCKLSVQDDFCEDVRSMGITAESKKYDAGFNFVDGVFSCKWYREGPNVPILQRYQIKENTEEEWEWAGKYFHPRNTNPDRSKMVNMGFDCANVMIEFAFSLQEGTRKLGASKEEYVGLIFRYNIIEGNEEYYLLKFDKEGAELILMESGSSSSLYRAEIPFDIVQGVSFYDVKLTYVGDNIHFQLMKDAEMEYRTMININDPKLHRGSVGFEKKGEIDINVNFFEVKDPRSKPVKENYIVKAVVKNIDMNMMESVCMQYKSPEIDDRIMHARCQESLGYCQKGCKKLRFYHMRFYNCRQMCHKKYDEWLAMQKGKDEADFPCKEIMPGTPFEKGLKVDYMPAINCSNQANEKGEYVPGWLDEAVQEGEICKFHIKYICNQGLEPKMLETDETDKLKFKMCGEGLLHRAKEGGCEKKVIVTDEFTEFNKLKNEV